MSSNSPITTTRDLQWALQLIRSGDNHLQCISFYQWQCVTTSHSYQETDNSLSISMSKDSNDVQFFCQLLSAIAASNGLMHLSFHGVEWKQEQLRLLSSLLVSGSSSIRQVEFQKNTLDLEGLSELSEMLASNRSIKVVILSECQIGSAGARLLASALTKNDTVEELQIWEDSICSTGAEELSRMIEVNYALKLLIIFDRDSIVTATPLITAVLARNRNMEVHIWGGDKGTKVVEFMPETGTLRIYQLINSWGSQRVVCALGWNNTVTTLDMAGVRLKSRWAREFRTILEHNRTLKDVRLPRTRLRDKALVYIAAGLFKNACLEKLMLEGNWFSGVGVEHLLCPLSRFSPLQNQANTTLKSLTFGGAKTKIGRDGVTAILRMLETNESIVHLGICDDITLKSADILKIFRSLQRNATLRRLSLKGCKGVEGEQVLQTILEILQVNPWIEEIDLSETPLQIAGKTDQVYEKLGQNGSLLLENDLLSDLQLTVPRCCRVFLCGQELAGKTTLCNSLYHSMNATQLPYMDQIRTLVNPVEQIARTTEIKIKTILDDDVKISIWNLGGQHESHALHDLMFPCRGSPSFFLIVSNLFQKSANRVPKSPEEIEEDLLYWLKFITSNSRRTGSRSVPPHITVVLTHVDKMPQISDNLQVAASLIQRLREDFRGYLEFYPTIFTVDARSSISVSKLAHHLRRIAKTVLQRVPPIYQLCDSLINVLNDWRTRNCNRPAIKWKEFCELCQLKVPSLRIRSRHDNMEKMNTRRCAVANSLHNVGEIIFFEELGFVILDCEWFCRDVLGHLINLDAIKLERTNGFVSRKELEKILRTRWQNKIPGMGAKVSEYLEANDLINMMLKLELCYEQDPGDPNTLLLVPAILEEGRGRTQKWQLSHPECIYVGRHLECVDTRHMFLTAGFFPRLQVHLHNKVLRSTKQQGATYRLEKYLISVVTNGIHIRVELGEQLGFYIDVLACSTKNVTEILKLFHQLIIPTILHLCPSITLTESIMRPDCIKYLTPHRFRRTQCVSLQQLKQTLLSLPADSMYNYQHTWSSVEHNGRLILEAGYDYARDLLSDEDFQEVLHRRFYDLHHLATELAIPQEKPDEPQTASVDASNAGDIVEPSILGIAKGVEMILQRLKTIEQEIKDLKQEIQWLRYYEHHLLIQLHRKVDYLVNYTIQLEERKVPHMFYFIQVENNSKRLVTRIFSGMTALRLHMLCEFRREMHVVDDQIGCELIQVDNQAVKCLLPYMSRFMKLVTFALKIGAHFIAGMGEMIPDLSREVAHLLDSSLINGATVATAGALGVAAIRKAGGSRGRNKNVGSSSDTAQDMQAARQWLVDFLKGQRVSSGMDVAERFGLWRVRYRDDGNIAWICRRHIAMRANEVIEVPV